MRIFLSILFLSINLIFFGQNQKGYYYGFTQGVNKSASEPETAPTIIAQPSSVNVNQGANTSFSVTATGGSLIYQWQWYVIDWQDLSNDTVYSGVTTKKLLINTAPLPIDQYKYRVIVSNSKGTATSNTAILTVYGSYPSCGTGKVWDNECVWDNSKTWEN